MSSFYFIFFEETSLDVVCYNRPAMFDYTTAEESTRLNLDVMRSVWSQALINALQISSHQERTFRTSCRSWQPVWFMMFGFTLQVTAEERRAAVAGCWHLSFICQPAEKSALVFIPKCCFLCLICLFFTLQVCFLLIFMKTEIWELNTAQVTQFDDKMQSPSCGFALQLMN